jgi:hypothetical protein
MNRAWKSSLMVALIATIMMASMASLAFANEAEPGSTPTPPAQGQTRGANAYAVLAYIAGKSGADLKVLIEELKSGKTLQEVAASNKVDWLAIQAVFAPSQAKKEEVVARLEKRIAALLEAKTTVEDRIAKLQEQTGKLQARIPEIKNETLKGFAQRESQILQRRLGLARERLALIGDELALANGKFDYAKSQ